MFYNLYMYYILYIYNDKFNIHEKDDCITAVLAELNGGYIEPE